MLVDEAGTSSRCPWHGDGCGIRVYRGLFKCTTMNKVFNADIAAARNILMTTTSNNTSMTPVTPRAPKRGGGNGRRPGQGLNLSRRRDVAQTSLLSKWGGGRGIKYPRGSIDDKCCGALSHFTPSPPTPTHNACYA
ncbi:MAG: transposase [Thaumarchaeota archaeon]|nr:transposase [Candidatus Wolframiiraptor allenii]